MVQTAFLLVEQHVLQNCKMPVVYPNPRSLALLTHRIVPSRLQRLRIFLITIGSPALQAYQIVPSRLQRLRILGSPALQAHQVVPSSLQRLLLITIGCLGHLSGLTPIPLVLTLVLTRCVK